MYKILDLFAGIGGFSLGLERAGMETAAFCEIDSFACEVLKKNWPGIPIYNDVKEVTNERLRSDGITEIGIVTGGFPCQDLSVAGKQRGIEGARSGLWSELSRIISEVRPSYAIVENVSALLSGPTEQPGRWFGRVLGDLAEIGYDAEWHCLPASSIGAPHERDRVFVVAYPNSIRQPQMDQHFKLMLEIAICDSGTWNQRRVDKPGIERVVNGIPERMDGRLKACGNAIVPQIAEMIGHAIIQYEDTKKPPGGGCTGG